MRVAVVGAGLFGCTTAVKLARAGHSVTLFERNGDIMHGASKGSCGRIHLGYHYPRSETTARAAINDTPSFVAEYPTAISANAWQHYVIAGKGKVSREQFTRFMNKLNMPYDECEATLVRRGVTDGVFLVPELLLRVDRMRDELAWRLRDANVDLRIWSAATCDMPGYDVTVMTTYGVDYPKPLQYEVTEVAVVKLDDAFSNKSFVVLDGPFVCVDPLPDTNLHLLYDVTHSVHHRNVGMVAEIPLHLVPLIDCGPVITPHTHVKNMLDTLQRFMHATETVEHLGSFFTVRAVLPDVDDTDERPTLLTRAGDTVHVLSGKLGSAVAAANRVVKEVS